MKLSVKVDYACRVLAQLARCQSKGVLGHIDEMAKVEAIPANYLVQILCELRNGGLIVSKRGKQGGYALARSPEEISLYDILKLVEGDTLELSNSIEGQSGRRVNQIWREMKTSFDAKCRSYTLDMLMAKGPDEMYYI